MALQDMTREDKAEFFGMLKAAVEAMDGETGGPEDKVVAVLCTMGLWASRDSVEDMKEAQETCDEIRGLLAEYKAAQQNG